MVECRWNISLEEIDTEHLQQEKAIDFDYYYDDEYSMSTKQKIITATLRKGNSHPVLFEFEVLLG